MFLLIAAGGVVFSSLACRRLEESGPATAPAFSLYRFDDHLDNATVTAPDIQTSARVADPVVWKDFLTGFSFNIVPRRWPKVETRSKSSSVRLS